MDQTRSLSWDAFISHASEDKDRFVRPLAHALSNLGARIWYDEFSLKPGDSLSRSIDKGLAESRCGIVILSEAFMNKPWPEYELRGLVAREIAGYNAIIPVWHGVGREEVLAFSPPLADKFAVKTAEASAQEIALQLLSAIRPDLYGSKSHFELQQLSSGEGLRQLQHEIERVSDESPGLLLMQGHIGAFSVVFSLLWFNLASFYFPNFWQTGGSRFFVISIIVLFQFFLIQWVSIYYAAYFETEVSLLNNRSSEMELRRHKLELRGRLLMALLGGYNALMWSVLIWLTGGAKSPFIIFYVMIFALTITRLNFSTSTIWISLYFFLVITIASTFAKLVPSPLSAATLSQISESNFGVFTSILAVLGALIVPTLSQYFIERRRRYYANRRSF
jgi:hypothetical protein